MRVRRVATVFVVVLVSLAFVPSVGGENANFSMPRLAATALPNTSASNGGEVSCPMFTPYVDIDLVPGGAWELSWNGWVTTRTFDGGSVAPAPFPLELWNEGLDERDCAVELVPTSGGYWMFTSKGRVLTAGGAVSHGDLSEVTLNDPIVTAAPTVSGDGYYMLGADGGVFGFGDAQFYGSVQGIVDETVGHGELASDHLHAPIVTMATTPAGYWLVAGDGAVFPFGDAPYYGSIQDVLNTGNQLAGIERNWRLRPPVAEGVSLAKDALVSAVIDVVPSRSGGGYMMLASDGGIFNFGQTQFHGSAAGSDEWTAVAADATPSGDGYVIRMTSDLHNESPWRRFGSLRRPAFSVDALRAPTDSAPLRIFARLRSQREEIISQLTDKINTGVYGVGGDRVLRGPAGFKVDLDSCPNGWSDTIGITDSEIRIGHTRPYSDWYGDVTQGWASYLDWVNNNDPIIVDGRPHDLVLRIKEDDYISTVTVEAVNELISKENVFSVTTWGWEPTLAVYDTLQDQCIPHVFNVSNHSALGDPVHHPWTTGALRSELTFAELWTTWIRKNLADQLPVKMAILTTDNYQISASRITEQLSRDSKIVSDIAIVEHNISDFVEGNDTSILASIDAIRDAGPDVLLVWEDGNTCGTTHQIIAESGLLEAVTVAATLEHCMRSWGHINEYSYGWMAAESGLKDFRWQTAENDSYLTWLWETYLNSIYDGKAFDERNFTRGHYYALPYVEALRIAAALPGGLSRSNFILAVRSLQFDHPLLVDGMSFSMNGNADAYPVEGAVFTYVGPEGPLVELTQEVIDLNGQTPNCVWDESNGRCR